MAKYSLSIWDSLKFEIFNAQEDDLADEALHSLRSLAKSLDGTHEIHESKSHLSLYLEPVARECNEKLLEPQQKQAQPAARIIGTLAATSGSALDFMVRSSLPQLLTLYQDAETFEMRRAILSAISVLLIASNQIGREALTPESPPPLSPFKERLFDMLLQAIMHAGESEISFRRVALENLTHLCACPGLLDASEVNLVGRHLCVIQEEENAPSQIRAAAIDSLSTLSSPHRELITEVALPTIFGHLPDVFPDMRRIYRLLNTVASLKLDQDLSSTLVRRLLNKATLVFEQPGNGEYFSAILATVNSVILQQRLGNESLLMFCSEKMLSFVGNLLNRSGKEGTVVDLLNPATILGRFTCLVIRGLNDDAQNAISKQLFMLLRAGATPYSGMDAGATLDIDLRLILRTYLFAGVKVSVSHYSHLASYEPDRCL